MSPMLVNPFIGAAGGGGGPGGFAWKRTVTIDHTQAGSTDTSNWVCPVVGTFAELKVVGSGGHVQNASGFDIGFYSDSALTTKLNWETERWVSTTGAVVYYVQIPTLSHTADTVIYLAYGSTLITTDQSNPTGTWDSNYKGVWHFGDGSTLSVADSTSNAHNMTTNGPPTATTGQIYGGISGNGSQDARTTSGGFDSTSVTSLCVEAWINPTSNSGLKGFLQWASNTAGNISSTPFLCISDNGGTLQYASDGPFQETSTSISTGTWYHVAITAEPSGGNTAWKYYKNGALLSTHTGGRTNASSSNNAIAVLSGYNGIINAVMDEVRVSYATRGPDYLLSTYNASKPSANMVTVGSETAA